MFRNLSYWASEREAPWILGLLELLSFVDWATRLLSYMAPWLLGFFELLGSAN